MEDPTKVMKWLMAFFFFLLVVGLILFFVNFEAGIAVTLAAILFLIYSVFYYLKLKNSGLNPARKVTLAFFIICDILIIILWLALLFTDNKINFGDILILIAAIVFLIASIIHLRKKQ